MEEKSQNILDVLKIIVIPILVITVVVLTSLFGVYMSERDAYIQANTSKTGVVVDKACGPDGEQDNAKYTVTVERHTTNSVGEVVTKSETYTISYADWCQIEEGYIATYNDDGSIDIVPPAEGVDNAENAGIVTDKSYTINDSQGSTKYTVTIDRQTVNAAGEILTKTETYAVSYEEWTQIEVGHIATYNDDGSVDIVPPAEAGTQEEILPPEPFGKTFWQYAEEKTTQFFTVTIPAFFSNETNAIIVIVVIFALAVVAGAIYRYREELAAHIDADTIKLIKSFLQPYADEEYAEGIEEIEKAEDDETDWGDDEDEDGFESYEDVAWAPVIKVAEDANGRYEEPATNHVPTDIREHSLTVRQVRALMSNMDQIEITESYITRVSGYNSSLDTTYDDRVVAKISVSSSISPKLVIDITPKTI